MKRITKILIITVTGLYAQVIKGTVADTLNSPIPNIVAEAVKTFYPDSVFIDTTDLNGNFFINVTPGYYEVKIHDTNFVPLFIPFRTDGFLYAGPGDTIDLGTITLYPFTSIETLKIKVYDLYTGQPINNAKILIEAPFDRWEGFTNWEGFENFELYSSYKYLIKVNKFGYKQKDTFYTLPQSFDSISVYLDTVSTGEFSLIHGKVFDFVTYLPLDSAWVLLDNITLSGPPFIKITDTNGFFLDTLPPGPYSIAAFRKNYLPQILPRIIFLQPGINTGPLRIPLSPLPPFATPGTLTVNVFDSLTLQPLKSSFVFLSDRQNNIFTSLLTNEIGTAKFLNIPSDTIYKYKALIFKRNYFKKKIFIGRFIPGGNKTVNVFLKPKFNPVISNGIIDGKVILSQNPASNAKVIIRSFKTRVLKLAETDQTGYFKFINLPPDSYSVFVYEKYAVPFDTLIFVNNDSVNLIINLQKNITGPHSIYGFVLDELSGYPLRNVLITAYDSSGNKFIAFTDSIGNFIIDSLPYKRYLLSARIPGYLTEFYENAYRLNDAIWIYPDNAEPVEFSLIPSMDPEEGVIIRGNVGRAAFKTLKKANSGEHEIYLIDLTSQMIISSTKTDKNGNYVLMGCPPNQGHDWTVYSISPGGEGYSDVFTFADDTSGINIITGIEETSPIDKSFKVFAYPTLLKSKINFLIEKDIRKGELSLFDITGRKVLILKKGKIEKGRYSFNLNLSSGIYFWILKEDNKKFSGGKLIKLR